MPWTDWQFYVVTVLALIGAWCVYRVVVPKRKKAKPQKTELTVGGRKV